MISHAERITLQPTHVPERRQRYELRRLLFAGSLMAEYLEQIAIQAELAPEEPERRLAAVWRKQLDALRNSGYAEKADDGR